MPVNITIRGVPDSVRDELAARASREGKSMQEFLRGELERLAAKPSIADWLDEVERHKAGSGKRLSAKEILDAIDSGRR